MGCGLGLPNEVTDARSYQRSRATSGILAIFTVVGMILVLASPASASAGSTYHNRITCSGLQAVKIYSSGGENSIDYYWDSGSVNIWNPYGYYKSYQTADTSTWAVIEWDHRAADYSGRYCQNVT